LSNWQIKRAVSVLRQGGVIAYPTESVYGLGCDPLNETAVKKLLQIKKRAISKGLIVISSNFEELRDLLQPVPPDIMQRLNNTWPGPVTWLLPAHEKVPVYLKGNHHTLAVRVSDHPIVKQLCSAFNGPIVSTSANIAGHPPLRHHLLCRRNFANQVNYILTGQIGHAKKPTEIRDGLNGRIIRAG